MSKPKPRVGMKVRFRRDNPKKVGNAQKTITTFKSLIGDKPYYKILTIDKFNEHMIVTVCDNAGKPLMCFNWWWLVPYKEGE